MKRILSILAALVLFVSANAQYYQFNKGWITISGDYNGNAFVPENRPPTTMAGSEMLFHDTLSNGHVHTKSHAKLRQQYNGMLILNSVSRSFTLTAALEHFPRGSVSCNLSAEFVINPDEFGINTQAGENRIAIRFTQLILKKPGEQ